MRIEPLDSTLGAVVRDVDLATIDDEAFHRIEAAWHEHAVLLFPSQHLSDADHISFTRRFGRLEMGLKRTAKVSRAVSRGEREERGPKAQKFRASGTSDAPARAREREGPPLARGAKLGRMSNVDKDGKVVDANALQARFQRGNQQWHSDSSYKRVGAKASILAAHVVPDRGGETEWADLRAAWDALDGTMQEWLSDKEAVHSYRFSHAWHGGLELLNEAELDHLPPVVHPLMRIHPATGRPNLFVGRHASHIVGEDLEESRRLLRRLTTEAGQPPRTWKHRWQPGDIVIWDNRCVLHRGHPWPADQARVMARSTVAGEDADNEWAMAD